MKKKIKIGIPRAFLYYRYYILWKNFFEKIDCNIILSPETNKEIIENGINNSIDESCLSNKIYMGHVVFLINKCDYILVPRIANYGKKERVCVKFNGLYDIIKNKFPNVNLLNYNIERTKFYYEFFGFLKLGLKLTKNIFKIIYAYLLAKKREKKYNEEIINGQNKILKNNNIKVLIVAHPYNIYDKYIGEPIINYLKSMNVDLLFADKMNRKTAREYSLDYSPTLYWIYSKELIGAIKYYKEAIDGIIFLSTFPCGTDSLVNELIIRKEKKLPIINLIIDESTIMVGLETRLESFVDVIKARREIDD